MEREKDRCVNDVNEMGCCTDKNQTSPSGIRSFLFFLFIMLAAACILFVMYEKRTRGHSGDAWIEVTYDEVVELTASGEEAILFIYRPSCSACSVVTVYKDSFTGLGLPIYALSMEPYRDTDAYERIKAALQFYYMPCFKYIAGGKELAHINNPLPDVYFETEDETVKTACIDEMITSISSFIKAAAGHGELITEAPLPPVIHGTVIEKPESPK